MSENKASMPEPWLRGTLTEIPPVARAVLHALELAQEDVHRWCGALSDQQLHARPAGLPPVAFQLRHIAGSIDRLLTYAEGGSLTEWQLDFLRAELHESGTIKQLLAELDAAVILANRRIRALASMDLAQPRTVGKKELPTTLGGLLVHVADHTQRHAGQAITTAKLVSNSKAF
jgi:uncharacterized damage-inducible protein DinB